MSDPQGWIVGRVDKDWEEERMALYDHARADDAWCFTCSKCGKSFPRNKLHLAHNHGEINYCPNCGRKVKQ